MKEPTLLEKLREEANNCEQYAQSAIDPIYETADLFDKAADEIERLQTTLRKAEPCRKCGLTPYPLMSTPLEERRTILPAAKEGTRPKSVLEKAVRDTLLERRNQEGG